jgi:2OG-Fe(II) oxygenase superfamily
MTVVDPIAWDALEVRMNNEAASYRSAHPFPHVVLDDFIDPEACRLALKEFEDLDAARWQGFIHINEKKYSHTNPEEWGPVLQRVLEDLNSEKFLDLLSTLTGIENLQADPTLEGGGLHRSGQGGFLNIHADYTVHPHQRHWARRVNLLVYLNEGWEASYGGDLELWSPTMGQCEKSIAPIFNRAVIFSTDHDSYHGHPEPMTCPPGTFRRSLALYYFTEDQEPVVHSTNYRPRPGDGWKRIPIALDRRALQAYDWLKRTTGISDEKMHRFFNFVERLKARFSKQS